MAEARAAGRPAVSRWVPVSPWSPVSPWAAVAPRGRFGGGRSGGGDGAALGIVFTPLTEFALATIVVRDGLEARLADRIRSHFGLDLPPPGKAHFGGAGDLVWSAPGQWLAVAPNAGALRDLPAALADVASVTDQSDARALLRITGPHSRAMLAKGFSIDLHPRAFSPGSAAVTPAAHIGAQIWQHDDAPTYVVAVARSFVGSFWAWATGAAAEYGYEVGEAGG